MFQTLLQIKAEIQKLKENIQRLEEIDESRAELNNLEMELQWATVSSNIKTVEIMKVFSFEKTFRYLGYCGGI